MSLKLSLASQLVALGILATPAVAAENEWTVRKMSGEVWIGEKTQPVSLRMDAAVKAGDTVTTGASGRVLLVRGEGDAQQSILISPNSVIGLPADKSETSTTTITQRVGTILLDVDKKALPHFEVETPFLAAVVKGTRFEVTVDAKRARVDVKSGQVAVADFKSGQIAQVMPGQAARALADGASGLILSGAGSFRPIEQGVARPSTVQPISVPKGGFRALPTSSPTLPSRAASGVSSPNATGPSGVRIMAPLGEVKLNATKSTQGLARSADAPTQAGRRSDTRETTIWSETSGNSAAAGNSAATSSAGATTSAPTNPSTGPSNPVTPSVAGPSASSSGAGAAAGGGPAGGPNAPGRTPRPGRDIGAGPVPGLGLGGGLGAGPGDDGPDGRNDKPRGRGMGMGQGVGTSGPGGPGNGLGLGGGPGSGNGPGPGGSGHGGGHGNGGGHGGGPRRS